MPTLYTRAAIGFNAREGRSTMIWATFLLILGLVLLLGGAKFLVDGVSALALAAGVSPLVIGLTVVAFGTSTPEVVINGIAAWKGETDLAFGNVIGSCAINVGFVLALTALIRPLNVERSIVTREVPLLMLAIAVFAVLSSDRVLSGGGANLLTRGDGIILLLVFCVFLYVTARSAWDQRSRDAFVQEVAESVEAGRTIRHVEQTPGIGKASLLTLGGIVGVAAGGRLAVIGATGIAAALGIPEVVVGLTIVSFGTTLPELATCIVAARRGQSDLAIGNIVGSNIYNILFIGGMVATIYPVPIPAGGMLDLAVATVLCTLLLPIAIRSGYRVTRAEGAVLLIFYFSYAVFRVATAR